MPTGTPYITYQPVSNPQWVQNTYPSWVTTTTGVTPPVHAHTLMPNPTATAYLVDPWSIIELATQPYVEILLDPSLVERAWAAIENGTVFTVTIV